MTPSGDLVDIAAAAAETHRMLGELGSAWKAQGITWAEEAIAEMRRQLPLGELQGALWLGPKDEAVGLATWGHEGEVGRRVSLFLSEGYRNPAAFRAFVDRISRPGPHGGSPVVAWFDSIPGVDLDVQRPVFDPRGAFHVVRIDLSYPLGKALFDAPVGTGAKVRPLVAADEAAVARLLERAYDDNPVERSVFVRFRDPTADAVASAHDLLHERYGRWMNEASFGAFEGTSLAAAVLVNDLHGPLVTEVMTDPDHRRKGHAAHLLRAAVEALRAHGAPAPRLVVTTWNERAYRLYRRLGFEPIPGSAGGVWLEMAALGLRRPDGPQGR